jgi:hypothetical protein
VQGLGGAQQTALNAVVTGSKSVFDSLIAASGDAQKSLAGWTFAINRQVATQEQQTALVTDMANSMGSFLIPQLSALKKTGENLADTAVRMRDEFILTNTLAKMIGQDGSISFGFIGSALVNFGIATLSARDNLVALMGGISGMNTTMQSYYQNFFTSAERHANDLGNLTLQFAALGFAIPATAAEFKALVSAQNLSTASGQQTFTSLMSLSSAFATLVQTADQAAAAQQAVTDNTAKARQALVDAALASYKTALTAVDGMRAFAASVRGLQSTLGTGAQSTSQGYASALSNFMSVNASAGQGDKTAQANLSGSATAFLDAAKLQAKSASDYARDYALVQNSLSITASGADKAVASADLQLNNLADINNWTKTIAANSVSQADSLAALVAQASSASLVVPNMDAMASINAQIKSWTDTWRSFAPFDAANMSYTKDATGAITGGSLDTKGVNFYGNMTVAGVKIPSTYVSSVSSSIGVDGKAGIASMATSSIAPDIQHLLDALAGTSKDTTIQASMADWLQIALPDYINKVVANDPFVTIADIRTNMKAAGVYDTVTQYIPAFASGGDHTGGLRLVGENGPELESTGPSRIFNADQTKNLLSGGNNQAVLDELIALRKEVINLRYEAQATAGYTNKISKSIDRAMPDGNSFAVSGTLDGGVIA